ATSMTASVIILETRSNENPGHSGDLFWSILGAMLLKQCVLSHKGRTWRHVGDGKNDCLGTPPTYAATQVVDCASTANRQHRAYFNTVLLSFTKEKTMKIK